MKTKVTLLSHTNDPVETLCKVWAASRNNKPLGKIDEGTAHKTFERVIDSKIPVAEMVDFVFLIEGVSVSLREQMVRHRVGTKVDSRIGCDIVPDLVDSTFWSQSMRILDIGDFAEKENYCMPDSVKNNCEGVQKEYQDSMHASAKAYRELVAMGVPLEDARNVVPLATTHRLVWKVNLASLMHIVGKRGCWILQLGLWKPVIEGMINELAEKVDPYFRNLILPPCVNKDGSFKGCSFKLDNQRRIDGEDEIPPCIIYLAKEEANALQAVKSCRRAGEEPCWFLTMDQNKRREEWNCADDNKFVRFMQMKADYKALWGSALWE